MAAKKIKSKGELEHFSTIIDDIVDGLLGKEVETDGNVVLSANEVMSMVGVVEEYRDTVIALHYSDENRKQLEDIYEKVTEFGTNGTQDEQATE